MKKILSLVLVLVMALSLLSIGAVAEELTASPTADEIEAETSVGTAEVETNAALTEEIAALISRDGTDNAAALSEYFGTQVEEVIETGVITLSGIPADQAETVILKLTVPESLTEGSTVIVLIRIANAWQSFTGTVEDGKIVLSLSPETALAIQNNGETDFVVAK